MAMKKKAFLQQREQLVKAADAHAQAAFEIGFAKAAQDMGLDEREYNALRKHASALVQKA